MANYRANDERETNQADQPCYAAVGLVILNSSLVQ